MKSNFIKKKLIFILLCMMSVLFVFMNLTAQNTSADLNNTEAIEVVDENNNSADSADNDEAADMQDIENFDSQIKEESNNLFSTVKRGGALMIFIVFLGLVSLTIIIERIIYFTRKLIWKADSIKVFLRDIAEKSDLIYMEDLEDELNKSFHLFSNRMERGLSLLSGIGNIAPIAGFLGTVIGMIRAFASIAAATTVNAKVVAVGIQIALVTTAGGLLIAAPTLAFYYLFTHVIQNRYADAEDVVKEICGNKKKLSELLDTNEEGDDA